MVNSNPYRAAGTFDGPSYVEREADAQLRQAIQANQRYPYLLAARQSGKSSLMNHIMNELDATLFSAVFIDISDFSAECLDSYDAFLNHLGHEILSSLNLSNELTRSPLSTVLLESIVSHLTKRILIFIDEIDGLLGIKFKDNFFGLIRSFFNKRARQKAFQQFQFILSGAAQPTELISKENRSPFNVGIPIILGDLSLVNVVEMVKYLPNNKWQIDQQIGSEIYKYTSGSVYLTQLALEKLWERTVIHPSLAINLNRVGEVIGEIIQEAPNNMHFLHIHSSIINKPKLLKAFWYSVAERQLDKPDLDGLKMTGITKGKGAYRNLIYESVFGAKGPLSLYRATGRRRLTYIIFKISHYFQWQARTLLSKPLVLEKPEVTIPLDSELSFSTEPEGSVPLGSPFYVERPPLESDCYKMVAQAGALIRIKAARQMGKTSLMTRILHHVKQQNYRIAYVSFQEADGPVFADLDKFLQWFCGCVTAQLNLANRVEDYWQVTYEGSKDKCRSYFQRYLLPNNDRPLVLGLDKVDLIFQYPKQVASEFFGLLRAWHERGKNEPVWQKLRLILVYSEEEYISLDINQSPFNVGTAVELPEFTHSQVQDLAEQHALNWSQEKVEQLMNLVGGHPYLVHVALYQIAEHKRTLENLLQIAHKETGPYSDHLHRYLRKLQENKMLATDFKQVITAKTPLFITNIGEAFKLRSLGLVKFQDDDTIVPLCELYRLYFRNRLN